MKFSKYFEFHYIVGYYGGTVNYRSLKSDKESCSLDCYEPNKLRYECTKRKVLVKIDTREYGLDLWHS